MLQTRLKKISEALVAVTNKTYHYFAPAKAKAPYIVWAESGEYNASTAENIKGEQAIYGFIDYFTATEFDDVVDDIQEALNGLANCYWQLNAVQYGDPTNDNDNLIHYTWEWRIW